jgi:Domain of unknown function (DUF4291)
MDLIVESYIEQNQRWPQSGRHILAQYDDESVIVYQAYRPSIGHFAARHGYFGGKFSFTRMSWIKPGFLWMMYRSGWSSKENQEVTLAIRIKRTAFDDILAQAVPSTYKAELCSTTEEWKKAVEESSVRIQWDPDHDPTGNKLERRAIQLGLRGTVLARYSKEWIISIEDISDFAHQQYQHVVSGNYAQLLTPKETVYPTTIKALQLPE